MIAAFDCDGTIIRGDATRRFLLLLRGPIGLAFDLFILAQQLLAWRFVFISARVSVRRSLAGFALVNLLAVLQTWLVSVGLRNWLLPILGVVAFRDLIAHGCGVAVPVLSSYFGHKHISFRNRF